MEGGFIAGLVAAAFFWPAFALAFVVFAMCCAEWETPGFWVFVFAGAMTVIWFGTGLNPFAWVLANPFTTAGLAAAYIAVGIFWSFFKWDRYCALEAQRIREKITQYNDLVKKNPDRAEDYGAPEVEVPTALENKYKFTTWIVLWWGSLAWFILSDSIIWIRDTVLEQLGGFYAAIANRRFKDLPQVTKPAASE